MMSSMRDLGSCLAALALSLALGAAGTQSSGTSSATGVAPSVEGVSPQITSASQPATLGLGPRTAAGGGWKRVEGERTGSGGDADRAHRIRADASRLRAPAPGSGQGPFGAPTRRSGGLLGLDAAPANAPPRS
jgi:hypothetical protein